MRLSVRLGFIYLTVVLLFIVAVYSASRTFTRVTDEARVLAEEDLETIQLLSSLRFAFDDSVQASRLAAASGRGTDEAVLRREEAARLLQELETHTTFNEKKESLTLMKEWRGAVEALRRMEGDPAGARLIFNEEVLPALAQVGRSLNRLEAMRSAVSHDRVSEIRETVKDARRELA